MRTSTASDAQLISTQPQRRAIKDPRRSNMIAILYRIPATCHGLVEVHSAALEHGLFCHRKRRGDRQSYSKRQSCSWGRLRTSSRFASAVFSNGGTSSSKDTVCSHDFCRWLRVGTLIGNHQTMPILQLGRLLYPAGKRGRYCLVGCLSRDRRPCPSRRRRSGDLPVCACATFWILIVAR